MTEIWCDMIDCKHAKEEVDDEGTVGHTNCRAKAINLIFVLKRDHPCTMYEKK